MADSFMGEMYDDDEDRVTYPAVDYSLLDPGVTRFAQVDVHMSQTARLVADVNNPGFRSVSARPIRPGWKVEMWKVKR